MTLLFFHRVDDDEVGLLSGDYKDIMTDTTLDDHEREQGTLEEEEVQPNAVDRTPSDSMARRDDKGGAIRGARQSALEGRPLSHDHFGRRAGPDVSVAGGE